MRSCLRKVALSGGCAAGATSSVARRWPISSQQLECDWLAPNLLSTVHSYSLLLFCKTHDLVSEIISVSEKRMKNCRIVKIIDNVFEKMTKVGYFHKPSPAPGGGGCNPPPPLLRWFFLAGPRTVWDRELILCIAAFLTFLQISWKFQVSMTFGWWDFVLEVISGRIFAKFGIALRAQVWPEHFETCSVQYGSYISNCCCLILSYIVVAAP